MNLLNGNWQGDFTSTGYHTGLNISGTTMNTGDENPTTIGNLVNGSVSVSAPVDADIMPMVQISSGILRKLTWANLKATLKTYFDSIYDTAPVARTYTSVVLANNTPRTCSTSRDTIVILTPSLQAGIGQTASIVVQVDNSGGGVWTTIATSTNSNALTITLGLLGGSSTQLQPMIFLVPKSSQYRYIISGTGTSSISTLVEVTL